LTGPQGNSARSVTYVARHLLGSFNAGTTVPESGPRDYQIPARAWDLRIMTSVFSSPEWGSVEISRKPQMSPHNLPTGQQTTAETLYTFDNSGTQAATRFSALADIFDPGTIRHLTEIGVGSGWHCLEIGAGGGSIATWLCDRVGGNGRVLATDIDTRFLETLNRSNLEVSRHDIASDPLPRAKFDLVHFRLVLGHLPNRDEVLGRLVTALQPGGWILAEEFDSWSLRPDRAINDAETSLKAFAAMQAVMKRHSFDGYYGRRLVARLRAHSLTEISAEGRVFMYEGGTSGADLTRAGISQTRDEMIDGEAISAAEIERDLLQLNRSNFMMPSPIMWAVRGRRPAGSQEL
jgi:2-polyprenyl-3-methyl-5-hydroxy-6-metoxy-1,4-benzoquinol methylase